MTLLFYTVAFLTVGIMLLAIALRPAMLQTKQPALTDMAALLNSRRAKHAYRGFYLLLRAVAKLALLLFDVLLVMSDGDKKTQGDTDDDYRYKHEGEKYYTHSTGDSNNSWY